MSILDSRKVDFIGIEVGSNDVILTISDHLDWKNSEFHLEKLQNKINNYIKFYESGQIYEDYPNAKGKNIIIALTLAEPLNEEGTDFCVEAKQILNGMGLDLRIEVIKIK
ncbi:MAG: hypothetical protein MI974_30610 [Chitinophagales bacterium]|nr:hypothetical protein [Chitinophagales bacterium]